MKKNEPCTFGAAAHLFIVVYFYTKSQIELITVVI